MRVHAAFSAGFHDRIYHPGKPPCDYYGPGSAHQFTGRGRLSGRAKLLQRVRETADPSLYASADAAFRAARAITPDRPDRRTYPMTKATREMVVSRTVYRR